MKIIDPNSFPIRGNYPWDEWFRHLKPGRTALLLESNKDFFGDTERFRGSVYLAAKSRGFKVNISKVNNDLAVKFDQYMY